MKMLLHVTFVTRNFVKKESSRDMLEQFMKESKTINVNFAAGNLAKQEPSRDMSKLSMKKEKIINVTYAIKLSVYCFS